MNTATQPFPRGMLTAMLAAALAAGSAAAGPATVDTSKWLCELCKFEDGLSGALDMGGGNVSDSSAKFGEYNGLNEEGGFVVGDGSMRYRGADAAYWNIDASNLGLDTRSLAAEGGQQGSYRLSLGYDESPHVISDSALTPFLGNGRASLTLPAGFPAGTTGLMPLTDTLRPVDLETQRKKAAAGASFTPARAWAFAVNFRHETRDGARGATGAFFVNASQLVAPVDYVTDQMDASASYAGARLQAKIAYYGSQFRNSDAALTWQNPFAVPAFPDAVAGQLALPPDNEFHQVVVSAGYQLTDRTRATANVAFGRMTQDQAFLAPTLNAGLTVPALSRASLDGRANTLNANLELNSAITDRLRLRAEYARNERDNRTPQAVYNWVTTDMFLGPPRPNLPYDFTQDRFRLRADYRPAAGLKTSIGFDYDSNERNLQEVDTTRENAIWGKIASSFLGRVDLTLKVARGDRSNSGYHAAAATIAPENPLLRKYNMADRARNSAELRADISATRKISIGLQADASEDKYSDSAIGLTSGRELNFSGDVAVMLSERTNLHLFGNRQVIRSKQAGSQAFSAPDWTGENKDTIDLAGLGIRRTAIKDKLDVGADYTYARTSSDINVNAPAGDSVFPELSSSRSALKVYAAYRVKDDLSLHLGYWYEHYDSADWMRSGVTPDTIPNVLTFGEQPPRYRVHVVALSAKYRF